MSLLEKVSLLSSAVCFRFHAIIQSLVFKYSQCIRSLQFSRNKKNILFSFSKNPLDFPPLTPPPLRFCLELTQRQLCHSFVPPVARVLAYPCCPQNSWKS